MALRLKFNTEIELKCYYLSGGRKVLEIQFPQRRPLHAKDKPVRGSSSAVYIARNTPRSNRGCHMHGRAWILATIAVAASSKALQGFIL